jgi:hypothetical protein
VCIVLLVAAHTVAGKVFELEGGGVTVLAKQCGMLAIQHENIEMIEGGWFPTSAGMTILAGSTFATGMLVIFQMAPSAGGWGVVKLIGLRVTFGAFHFFMFADQLKASHCMVKMGILPAFLSMAGITGGSKLTLMGLVF